MHKLLKSEINELDNYWKFIDFIHEDLLKKDFLYSSYQFRKDLIKKIRKNYTAEEFYKFEKILNKLLWNLMEHIDFNIKNINISTREKLYNNNIKPLKSSFSHKLYLHNEKNNKKYFFKYYPILNKFDNIITKNIIKKIFTVLTDRNLYEKVMKIKNKKYIYKIKYIEYYYPLDYPFPNINLIFYNENKKESWLERINKLYFNEEKNSKINNEWYEFK
jgi:hypothetical protein